MTVLPLTFPDAAQHSEAMETFTGYLSVLAVLALLVSPLWTGVLHDRRIDRELDEAASRNARERPSPGQPERHGRHGRSRERNRGVAHRVHTGEHGYGRAPSPC